MVDSELKHVSNKKQTAFRIAKRSHVNADWKKYRSLRNKLNKLLEIRRDNFITQLGTNVQENPKSFWAFVKSKQPASPCPIL